MNTRDFDYVEARLLAPCPPASEAYERLVQTRPALAERLMQAQQRFTDDCRDIRRELGPRP